MIVKDVNGQKLSLTRTRLVEIEHKYDNGDDLYQAALIDIARATFRSGVRISIAKYGNGNSGFKQDGDRNIFYARFNDDFNIGCREFSEETFNYIVAYAKRITKAKKRKARAAKA